MADAKDINEISRLVIGAAIEVHDAFGPGLYEKVYLGAMVVALADRGLECRTQVPVQVTRQKAIIKKYGSPASPAF